MRESIEYLLEIAHDGLDDVEDAIKTGGPWEATTLCVEENCGYTITIKKD